MATRTNSPQVAMLLKEVEKCYGHPVKGPSDFLLLADSIEKKLREHISDSTVKRLWMPSLAYETVSNRTLDVFAKYAGYLHFDAFLNEIAGKGLLESELIEGGGCVRAADLKEGDIVAIAWMPDRECRLKYLGDRKFEVIESLHSKIQAGDTFFCTAFIKGRKLYVDNLSHGDKMFDSYGMGTHHGLTRAEIEGRKL